MSAPYYHDQGVTLWHGDAKTVLAALPSQSVNTIVTSPPYFGLRDYGVADQLGTEPTLTQYIQGLRAVFTEARRVLADDGTLWLNLGDSYVHKRASGPQGTSGQRASRTFTATGSGGWDGLPDKNLAGVPWRVAFALQDDGWILRNDIIWHKPNAMPESVKDRLSNRHEHLFLFTKSERYWFDLDPIREQAATADRNGPRRSYAPGSTSSMGPEGEHRIMSGPFAGLPLNDKGKNPGDIWTIATQPFPGAHFATMPSALAERALLAGCKPGGVVLDPFSGSGTTGMAAAKHGRGYVGIDVNVDYLDLSLTTRLAQPSLNLEQL